MTVTAVPPVRRRTGAPLPGLLVLILLWELAARLTSGTFVLAAPSEVVLYLAANWRLVGRALLATLGNAAAGFLAGNLAAVALAGIALVWPRSERVVTGVALIIFCLPLVATGPILRVIFGPGSGPQIMLAALAVYYTTLIPLLVGLRAAPQSWFDLLHSYGRGRLAALVHVRSMAALPYFLAGLQIAAPAAFLGAMVGEFTGAERGLGVLTVRAIGALDLGMTWGIATVATTISIAAYLMIGAAARYLLKAPPPVILTSSAPPRARTGGWREGIITCAVLFGLWIGALWVFDLNPFFAKGPGDVLQALVLAPDAAQTRGQIGTALSETAMFLLPGYLAGLLAGAGLGVVLIMAPALAGTALPLAIALRSVPIVTTAPLVVLVLGRGAAGTITLVAIMVFFPTFVACLHGLRQVPGQIMDVFASYAAGRWARLIRVRIPAMLPAFFAAARMAVPASVLAVTVVEWLATGQGIGSLMALSASLSDYDMLWSCVLVVTALSVLMYGLVGWVERRVLQVYAPEQLA
ncbi:ABC transporter permease [Pseudooceanicola sp. C21-150M6]|uniref:ABC transporter permease n=1 Tax=Pseudooceanicola sp. C21-150M6 TaxID=3434355 RepID=UPI003D7FC5F7